MKTDTKFDGNFVMSMLILVIVGIAFIVGTIFTQKNSFEEKRQACNRAVLTKGQLSEEIDFGGFWFGGKTGSIEDFEKEISYLEKELSKTNKEVNDLRALFGCYFDEY